nr:DUF262 domain-containing HNH endonuclease family protein [uncultured Draconibacterium sp.]
MKTESHSIHDVLAKNATSFFIPPFQRAYAWGKPEIDRYFNDILRIVNSEMNPKQHDKLEHFFGTLVIKEEKTGFANKSVVVDGQQRLTTTLLFLIALRDSEIDSEKQELIKQNYLTNNSSTFQDKIKLKQVTKDWDAFRALVNKAPAKPGIINNGYQLFSKLLNDKKRTNPEIELEHYITAIRRMNVAVIFLDERPFKGEDPQIIFETLNSLGRPLTLSDLIRNFVLLNMDSESQSSVYEKTWHPKIEAVLNDNTSLFFRDYLQYKTVSSIKVVSNNNTKEVYQQFKQYVNDNFENHQDFINDIVRYTIWYKWIISIVSSESISIDPQKNNEIKELLRNIFHDIKSEAFKPFVLGLIEYHQTKINGTKISDDLFISILKTIRTYLIRRRISGLTQGENKNIVLLSKRLEDIAKCKITMMELLSNMFYSLRIPNDNDLRKELAIKNFYKDLKKYSKFILGKIEEHNAKVAVDFRNPKITIEHIMPQKLDKSWESDLGDNFEIVHKTYLHNIGNLILTEFNSEIGNKPFLDKKKKLESSSLFFRRFVTKKDIWDERRIQKHQEKMITWLLETFPLPDENKESDNWNTKVIESTTFSPLDNEAGEIAEGNKPRELHIESNIIKVNTWQDVLIKFLKFIKDSPDYDFGFLLDNQIELFKKNDVIIKWAHLKLLVDDNIDLTNRFKAFDGKVWDKVKNLTDDELFIHVNISSYTCMTRIASIMNKFNISETSVLIVLK